MTISQELFLALLAMDSYNRGYGQGIAGLEDTAGLGTATFLQQDKSAEAQSAGFYGIAYTVGAGVEGIAAGTTVIAYRGTDSA